MHAQKILGSRRHVLTRFLVTTALLGSTFLVGLATTASAVGTDHIVVATQPSSTVASGATFAQQPIVQLQTAGDAVDASATGNVTVTITSGLPSTLIGTATVAAVAGVATFSGLGLNALVGSYTLTFADATDSATTTLSNPITVTVGTATKLAFATAPSAGAVSGLALTPQPVVDVVDSGGNIVTTNTTTVTAAFTGAGSTLVNNTKAAVAGVATFSGLAITAPIDATTGVLNFTDGAFPTLASVTMAITGPASKVVITTVPSTTAASGVALATQPVITVEDASGAVLRGDTSTVTATLVGGTAGLHTHQQHQGCRSGCRHVQWTRDQCAGRYLHAHLQRRHPHGGHVGDFRAHRRPGIPTRRRHGPSTFTGSGLVLAQQPVIKAEDSGGNVVATVTTGAVTASVATGSRRRTECRFDRQLCRRRRHLQWPHADRNSGNRLHTEIHG